MQHIIFVFVNPEILVYELLRLHSEMLRNPLDIGRSEKRSGRFTTIRACQTIGSPKLVVVQFLHHIIDVLGRLFLELIEILLVLVMLIFGELRQLFQKILHAAKVQNPEPFTLNPEPKIMKDLFGQAILDYQTNNSPEDLITETDISEADEMSVAWLFRTYKELPKIEKKALDLAKGKVLDVGCGAGSHSLYLQNDKKLEVVSIDISANAIEACRLRGLKDARVFNVLEMENEKFDTIILLMNGTGIFGRLAEISKYLQKLKSLLNEGGQILLDSSDIIYMFDEDEDGAYSVPADRYYGELTFDLSYKGQKEEAFPWLYLDYNTLQNAANANGLQCELLFEGEHFDYLAKLF